MVLHTVQPTEHGSEHAVDQAFWHEIESQLSALSRFCKSLAHNHWDAEELLQETLLKAFVAYHFSGRLPTKSYLFKIAQNAYIDGIGPRLLYGRRCREGIRFD